VSDEFLICREGQMLFDHSLDIFELLDFAS
jgi:hypothetical protein